MPRHEQAREAGWVETKNGIRRWAQKNNKMVFPEEATLTDKSKFS